MGSMLPLPTIAHRAAKLHTLDDRFEPEATLAVKVFAR
jgi:hypothetical protein